MVDVLSQNEIDALLAALSSGEMDAEELKKEEIPEEDPVLRLQARRPLFEGPYPQPDADSRKLRAVFDDLFFRPAPDVRADQRRQVEQLPYDEFIRSIPKMTILNMFEAEPLEGRMVLEVHPNVAYAMLDRLLGGPGQSPPQRSTR